MNAPPRSQFALAFQTCVDILRFRKGPEDMPASSTLLWAAIIGAVLVRIVGQATLPAPETTGNPVVVMAVELGLLLLGLKLALRVAGHDARFMQTATAMLGCQLVMSPALLLARWLVLTYFEQPGLGSVARLFFAVVAVWLMIVTVRILRSATGWPVFACIVLALGIEMLILMVVFTLYPPVTDPLAPAAPA